MKRDIKFRFWGGVKMFYDLENVMECLMQQLAFSDTWNDNGGHVAKYDHIGLHGSAFMQFTGLKDRNKKEIYEGGIIEYNTCGLRLKACIIWNSYCGSWQYQYNGAMGGNPSDFLHTLLYNTRFPAEVEIVGNIYENPKLIKP